MHVLGSLTDCPRGSGGIVHSQTLQGMFSQPAEKHLQDQTAMASVGFQLHKARKPCILFPMSFFIDLSIDCPVFSCSDLAQQDQLAPEASCHAQPQQAPSPAC